MLNREVFTMEV